MQVIARMAGGLGNQMFQYAAAFAVARSHHASVGIDVSSYYYADEPNRQYMLDRFTISGKLVSPGPFSRCMYKLASGDRSVVLAALARRGARLTDVREAKEYYYIPPSVPRANRVRLLGYWQSYRYFEDFAADIRKEFTLRDPLDGRNAAFYEQIAGTPNAVSVHVRRGDYLKARPQALLPIGYYDMAAQIVMQKVPSPTFFLFSDDIAWARQNLQLPGAVVTVDASDQLGAHKDLRLMSACQHHIVANSSFSWWGAWLHGTPDALVIAPRYWMGRSESFFPDLFPRGWRVIWPDGRNDTPPELQSGTTPSEGRDSGLPTTS